MPTPIVRCSPDPSMLSGFASIRERLDIPFQFPAPVLEAADEAAAAGPTIPDGADSKVRDALDLPFIAIDPVGSTDLDQAFTATRHNGGYRVFYAIADVAAWVTPGGPIDDEAKARGVTLYSPDIRTSLHPERISEDAGSLLQDQPRRALLWTIDLDERGVLLDARLERADVRNRLQLSYREAQAAISTNDESHPAHVTLQLLREIGQHREELERQRGAVSLALPAQEVVRGDDGRFHLEFDESLPVEGWNAQISLLTGIAASRIMLDAGVGILRTLPEPDRGTITQLRRTAAALGIDWHQDTSYADRVRSLHPDTPERAAMLSQAARGLRGAGYVAFADHDPPAQPEHSAIASTYSHVTAPLRRLCDRFANEIVLAHCADQRPPSWALEALEELPSLMGAARTRDRALERAVVDYVEARLLESRVGETFRAVVTDVDPERDRGRIQLRDPAVVARVPAAGLTLGDEVDVQLKAADPTTATVEFVAISK